MEKRSLKFVNVDDQVWQRIWEKLPKMEYAIPGSKEIIKPHFLLALDADTTMKTYLILKVEHHVSQLHYSFFCEEIMKMPFGWYDICDRDDLKKETVFTKVDEERLSHYVKSKANEIKGYFQHRCDKVPWQMASKICYSVGKLPIFSKLPTGWAMGYDIRTNKCYFSNDSRLLGITSSVRSVFYFRGDVICKPESDNSLDSLSYLMKQIITYAGSRLNPITIGNYYPMKSIEMKKLHGLFREYIHLMQNTYVYCKYKDQEEAFNKEKYVQMEERVDKNILKHIGSTHKHFWKTKHDEELKKAEEVFSKIGAILNAKWWLEQVA